MWFLIIWFNCKQPPLCNVQNDTVSGCGSWNIDNSPSATASPICRPAFNPTSPVSAAFGVRGFSCALRYYLFSMFAPRDKFKRRLMRGCGIPKTVVMSSSLSAKLPAYHCTENNASVLFACSHCLGFSQLLMDWPSKNSQMSVHGRKETRACCSSQPHRCTHKYVFTVGQTSW
jgi:hypothetical protein